jgi:tetratricopeptide (TPR) repeat protein
MDSMLKNVILVFLSLLLISGLAVVTFPWNSIDSDTFCNRGDAYLALGDYAKAKVDFEHALRLNP